jgi:hypothetical protein
MQLLRQFHTGLEGTSFDEMPLARGLRSDLFQRKVSWAIFFRVTGFQAIKPLEAWTEARNWNDRTAEVIDGKTVDKDFQEYRKSL